MPNENRTAFVTGAGKNIGRSIAFDLAGRGYNLVINGRKDQAACEEVAAAVGENSGPFPVADRRTSWDRHRRLSPPLVIGQMSGMMRRIQHRIMDSELCFLGNRARTSTSI